MSGSECHSHAPSPLEQSRAIAERLPVIGRGMEIALEEVSGARQGFLLMVFTPDTVQYDMNVKREFVRAQIAQLLARWDAEPVNPPSH